MYSTGNCIQFTVAVGRDVDEQCKLLLNRSSMHHLQVNIFLPFKERHQLCLMVLQTAAILSEI